jgi:hypothetical protein
VRGILICFHEDEALRLGSAEIRVFHDDQAFAAPDLIFHYVTAHRYAPPPVFVAGVMTGPPPESAEYQERLAAYDRAMPIVRAPRKKPRRRKKK